MTTTSDQRPETRDPRRVALVTGGARGIGLGISLALAKEGWSLAVCGVREAKLAKSGLDALFETGADVLYVQADVSKRGDRAQLVEDTLEKFGQIHLLVNNAGIAPKVRADILEATEESFDDVIGVNLRGPYFLTQRVANQMVAQRKKQPDSPATIVSVSSISATVASPLRGEYCISKAGVSMATQLWAVRLAEFGIHVYEVRPGVIKTDMTSAVEAKYDKLIAEGLVPQGRWGLPDDVGRAVAMLGRGDLPYSTGQVVMVDGGLTLSRL